MNSTLHSLAGYASILIFVAAYAIVMLEEKLHIRKSKPVLFAAGLIWMIIGINYGNAHGEEIKDILQHSFLEFSELFFFLLVAMTYINTMIDLRVFDVLRDYLISKNLSYRQIFWLTGSLAFLISPLADNLTTALIMCAVVLSMNSVDRKFISLCCINIVVGANAGGAFSPFGDITTLMVWQKGLLPFAAFSKLFIPSLINFLIPAFIMQFWIEPNHPKQTIEKRSSFQHGALPVVGLFLVTIVTAVSFHNFLHLPPVIGMMFGLSFLKIYGFFLKTRKHNNNPNGKSFDIFAHIATAEWDTLFFFYGVIMSVGGLAYFGYLELGSNFIYGAVHVSLANSIIGVLSAIVDNIPVMYAVLTMNPDMNEQQWLLVTLTAGVGGSLLSIGSAAGVALMGQARGYYSFVSHLRWTPVIFLGYIMSIAIHLLIN
jgi:Na+/H+ antiporter NhaD/arsenite permease-like protein